MNFDPHVKQLVASGLIHLQKPALAGSMTISQDRPADGGMYTEVESQLALMRHRAEMACLARRCAEKP